MRVLRGFCFLSLCHLGGSCWGGRALCSTPVGDGEKKDRCAKKLAYILVVLGATFVVCVGGLGGGYECRNVMVLRCMRASHYLCVFVSSWCVFFVGMCFLFLFFNKVDAPRRNKHTQIVRSPHTPKYHNIPTFIIPTP